MGFFPFIYLSDSIVKDDYDLVLNLPLYSGKNIKNATDKYPFWKTDEVKNNILKRLEQWKAADIVMERERWARIDHADCRKVIEALDDAFESAMRHTPVRRTSGMVQQQAWFARLRR